MAGLPAYRSANRPEGPVLIKLPAPYNGYMFCSKIALTSNRRGCGILLQRGDILIDTGASPAMIANWKVTVPGIYRAVAKAVNRSL